MRFAFVLGLVLCVLGCCDFARAEVVLGLVSDPVTGDRVPSSGGLITLYVVAEPSPGVSLSRVQFEMPAPPPRELGPYYLGSRFAGTDANPDDLVWDIEFGHCISLDSDSLVVLAEIDWLYLSPPYQNEELCIRSVGAGVYDTSPLDAVDCDDAPILADLSEVGWAPLIWISIGISRGCVLFGPCCDPTPTHSESWGTVKSRY